MSKRSTVLVLGASGMLGHTVLRVFAQSPGFAAVGSVRSRLALSLLPKELHRQISSGVDVENVDSLLHLFSTVRPNVVINCIGLVKQLADSNDPRSAIYMNALLPHRLVRICKMVGARLVHVSTDCVFSGARGMYRETDAADAKDLYGRSKFLGEIAEPETVTLRTSIIGPEINGAHGLVSWFLSQQGLVKGYTHAVFSGLPTVELARVIRDFVIPMPGLHGIYHVSGEPISKHDLLALIARVYGTKTEIEPDGNLVIDRSLDSSRFRKATGYVPPAWPELVRIMHEFG